MLNIRTRVEKTKEFVKKHQTLSACAVTAVVVSKITRKNIMNQVTPFLYEKGYEHGQLTAACSDAFNFILAKDLMEEFIKTAPRLEV